MTSSSTAIQRKRAPGGGRKPRPDAAVRIKVTITIDRRVFQAFKILNPESVGDAMCDLLVDQLAAHFEPAIVCQVEQGWTVAGSPTTYSNHLDALLAALELHPSQRPGLKSTLKSVRS